MLGLVEGLVEGRVDGFRPPVGRLICGRDDDGRLVDGRLTEGRLTPGRLTLGLADGRLFPRLGVLGREALRPDGRWADRADERAPPPPRPPPPLKPPRCANASEGDSNSNVASTALLTVKVLFFCANLSDQRERATVIRAVARFGWRPCRPAIVFVKFVILFCSWRRDVVARSEIKRRDADPD